MERAHWLQVLEVLELGTLFGLTDTEHGQIAWLHLEGADGENSNA
ncbi:hypothetical protein ACIQWB_10925 [Streptomyces olivaceus]